jgi:GntR family transcriptional regulator, transcriptional repressor for pyruvate dehydrogenase complex
MRPDQEASEWVPVRRSKLSEEVADQLVDNILSGKFIFGQKLPAERDLAGYLDVARPTLREALHALRVIGLLEVRPGEGTFVVNRHADFVAKAFSWAVLLDHQAVGDIVESRIAIESELAGLAAVRASPGDLRQLDSIVGTMRTSQGNRDKFAAADLEFHLLLGRSARNTTLDRLLEAIRSLLKMWILKALADPTVYSEAVAHHEQILLALHRRDPEGARRAMRTHLHVMGQKLLDTYGEPFGRQGGHEPVSDAGDDASGRDSPSS